MDSLYLSDGDGFLSTEQTRGPWSAAHQHGGPVAALLAREIERRLADDAFFAARFTVELLKPVPIARLVVAIESGRQGRKVRTFSATMTAAGEPVARAQAMFLKRQALDATAGSRLVQPPPPDASTPFAFSFFREPIGYHTAVQMRVARGSWGTGAMTVWMRLAIAVVAGEAPTPLQRVLVVADSGNGVSAALDPARYTFVNPDLTVVLHRAAVGEWVCLDATTTVGDQGVGLAECALFDPSGALGRSLQSLVVERR